MRTPNLPESNHPIIKSLFHFSDADLLTLFQRHPEQGKYFTAIFCRYSPIVYMLISQACKSPVQAEYLYAKTWRHIFYEFGSLDLRVSDEPGGSVLTLQNWLINTTAVCVNGMDLPPVESIQYNVEIASPPLWCYLQQALDLLPPLQRIIVLMSQTFGWSESRIAAYLQAEGEEISPAEVRQLLEDGCRRIQDTLPADIHTIYLDQPVGVI
ncbi:sigma-70 family RNA polymerase sigma factor [Ancylothrix sp. C2]|uniref:sigma factor-like helix-turn-helix DNA-binding protein n=1 Tax=Ancylothrix sp. D3o TaxID=2953691 RepID=UPI0021BB4188|nr:sigma factor-like helix-turn-helix DNA-binding protein [Ancylothrix sp. D3o]MCT7949986.1 sigma-70 family RNA polymerase sigma factor [Ancylothrix sp. D3o]